MVVAEGSVDVASCAFGVETDRLVEVGDGLAVLLMAHQDVGLGDEGIEVEFVHFQGFVYVGFRCGGVLLLHQDLGFDGVAVSLFCPFADDDVGDAVSAVKAVYFELAECEVMP